MNDLKLIPTVEEIISFIEDFTKKKFEFVLKNDLPVLATVKIARKKMPNHIILYKDTTDKTINHIIAHECGHIKRIYETPEDKRILFASNQQTQQVAFRQMMASKSLLASKFGKEAENEILLKLFNGIISQVTNQPIDLMIEKWIYNDYPALRQIQLDSLISQNKMALSGLGESTQIFPQIIVEASNTLNSAYADQLTKIVKYKLNREWKKSPYSEKSKGLSEILDVPKGWSAEDDAAKVIACAEFLNVQNWFYTAPFEDIPDNYL